MNYGSDPNTTARVKVLNPLTSTGPSMHAQLVSLSDAGLQVRVPCSILRGSTVQVRTREGIVFGKVRACTPVRAELEIAQFQIDVALESRL